MQRHVYVQPGGLGLVVVLGLQALDAGHLHVLDKGVQLDGKNEKKCG